ncbi:Aspartokinase [Aspergillus wentii]|nr:Aspartokinase [Aspergillus wentii]
MKEAISLALGKPDIVTFPSAHESVRTVAPRPWIVQKFGGTSIGHFASKIVEEVIFELETDGASFSTIIDQVRLEHTQAAEREIRSREIRGRLIDRIRYECACVVNTLNAAYFLGEISPACVGRVVSAGERMSCHYVTAILQDHGREATCVDVSELSVSAAVPGSWTDKEFVDAVAAELSLKACSVPGIPVITGYFGLRSTGTLLSFVGRGYTDLCAALVATGLDAAQLQIWKEVDGVFTADPRHVPDAKLLHSLSISELRNLTFYGSEVVHCAAVDVAKDRNLAMSIRNVRDPLGSGTLVTPDVEASQEGLMAITKKSYMAIVSVRSPLGMPGFKFQSRISDILQKWQFTGELVTISESGVSLAIPIPEDRPYGALQPADVRLWSAIEELKVQFTAVKVSHCMALLCVVCRLTNSMDFALACILRVLRDLAVPVRMVLHGAIDTIAGCVIEEAHAELATKVLHRDLFSAQTMASPASTLYSASLDEIK